MVYKSSFDKANRSAPPASAAPGWSAGWRSSARSGQATGLRVLTDVHETAQVRAAAEVVDVLQVPAFLCRQTDLVRGGSATGRPV